MGVHAQCPGTLQGTNRGFFLEYFAPLSEARVDFTTFDFIPQFADSCHHLGKKPAVRKGDAQ